MKRLVAAAISIFVGASQAHSEVEWAVARHEYRGLPLFLRYPVGLNYDAMQPKYPLRVIVTLKLAEVLENGLPEGKYNRSMEGFDGFVTRRLSPEFDAQCVLVETFNGKRIFYAYASNEAVATSLRSDVRKQFPKDAVTVEVEPDPKWALIRNYASEYFPSASVAKNDG